jgi:hypothetical protein
MTDDTRSEGVDVTGFGRRAVLIIIGVVTLVVAVVALLVAAVAL